MESDDQRWDDEHEDVFLDGNAEQFDAGTKWDLEHTHGQRVPVPHVGERVQNDYRSGRTANDTGVKHQRERHTPPEQFGHEIRVWAEHPNIRNESDHTLRSVTTVIVLLARQL